MRTHPHQSPATRSLSDILRHLQAAHTQAALARALTNAQRTIPIHPLGTEGSGLRYLIQQAHTLAIQADWIETELRDQLEISVRSTPRTPSLDN